MRASISIRKNENIGLPRHVIDMSYIIFHHNTAAIYAVYLGTRVMRKHHFTQISLQHVFRRCCDQTFRFFFVLYSETTAAASAAANAILSTLGSYGMRLGQVEPIYSVQLDHYHMDLPTNITRLLSHKVSCGYHGKIQKVISVTTVPLAKNDWNWCPHDADLIFRQKILQSVSLLG